MNVSSGSIRNPVRVVSSFAQPRGHVVVAAHSLEARTHGDDSL